MAAIRAGEIDFAVDVPLEQVASIATTEGVELLQQRDGITASYMTIIFNYRELSLIHISEPTRPY